MDDDFDLNDDLEVAAHDDSDTIEADFSRHETEESLHSEFRAFHEFYEAETGEQYDARELPESVLERFSEFDFETGRHLSLVESVQRVIQDNQREAEEEAEFLEGFDSE